MKNSSPLTTGELLREVVTLYVRSQRADAACTDGGLTVQCHVLNELLRHAPLTQQALAGRLGLDKGWISRAVDALVADNAVVKLSHDTDKRSYWLVLTRPGRLRAKALNHQLNRHADRLLSCVPDKQQDGLRSALGYVLQALEAGVSKGNDVNSNCRPRQP